MPPGSRLAALLVAGLAAACAADDAALADAAGDGADGGDGEVSAPRVVTLDAEEPLVLLPGQKRFLGFSIRPPAALEARVALLGDYRDAFVGSSVVSTDEAGQGSFTLAAPSTPAEFRLRISVPGGAVEVGVVPGGEANSPLRVTPRYAGQRELGTWYASVGAGARCPAAGGQVPNDGPLVGVAGPAERPLVPGVPLGAPITVLLRSERFAWGCLALPEGVALPAAGAAEVEVAVTDVPLRLDAVSLELDLAFSPREDELTDEAEIARELAGALFGPDPEADALLAGLLALGGPALESRAERAGFGELARSHLAGRGAEGYLAATFREWVVAGLAAPRIGPLRARLGGSATAPGLGTLELLGFPALPGAGAGLPPRTEAALRTEPVDQLLVGAAADIDPRALVGALTDAAAAEAVPGADGAVGALAALADCVGLGAALAAAEPDPSCGGACLAALCRDALSGATLRVREALAASAALDVALSAAVTRIDGDARPRAVQGTWAASAVVAGVRLELGGGVESAL